MCNVKFQRNSNDNILFSYGPFTENSPLTGEMESLL